MRFFTLPLLALANWPGVLAQTPPGPVNTNPSCGMDSDGVSGSTYYYAPDDLLNFNLLYRSSGVCDTGSYAQMVLIGPSGTIQCGYAPLDGVVHQASCDIPRGSMPAGSYQFRWYAQPNGGGNFIAITITHAQTTVTDPTPTTTVTTTPTSFQTATDTVTETDTETSLQITVTSPSSTATNIFFVTPKPTKITTTRVITFTKVFQKQTITRTIATITAPCYTPTLHPCRSVPGGRKREVRPMGEPRKGRLNRRALHARTIGGGPLTTTITPPVVVVTNTADATTSTITVTTNAPDVTITVPNPTPTFTVLDGTAVVDSTSTLPQKTKTKTRRSFTVTATTTTRTLTLTRTVKTTPPCAT